MAFQYEFDEKSYIPKNINVETFDDVAEDILAHYEGDALWTTMIPVPIDKFANDFLGINIVVNRKISPTSTSMAIITFFDGEVDVYEDDCSDSIAFSVKRGTLLINNGKISNSDKNVLIAQGCVYWHLHQMYFEQARKVDSYSAIGLHYPLDFDVLNNEQIHWEDEASNMSAQSLGVALCLLMPRDKFQQKVKEELLFYDIAHLENSHNKLFREIATKLASLFDVSIVAVFHRLVILGLLTADDISFLIYKPNVAFLGKQHTKTPKIIKSSMSSFTRNISTKDAFSEFQANESFRDLLQSHNLLYIDGVFVINNAKFVSRDEIGKLHLTEYAINNPSECSLIFTYGIQVDDSNDILPQYTELTGDIQKILSNARFMSSSGFSYKKLPHYVPNKSNNHVLNDAEVKVALENVRAEFEDYYNEHVAIATATDFWSRVEQIKKAKGINDNMFLKLTYLDDKTISRTGGNIPKGKRPPKDLKGISIRVAMAVCVGLNLDIKQAEELLTLAKHALNNERECMAYRYILTAFKDCSMDERNEVLEEIGIDTLGVQ